MKKEPVRSLFVRFPESKELPPKADILKGLLSKDLREKAKYFNYLILSILNEPTGDQHLLNVINSILPFQGQSLEIKRLLLIYWEIVQKRKHDGGVLDEFMLVCNNLRNDLNHANEYIIGLSLKLIGRIAIREIMDALIAPILAKLNHIENFVKRNAIECLHSIFERFGNELLHDIDDRMLELLAKETDQNTVRNAILLLFKANPEKAVKWVAEKLEAEGLDEFGSEIVQIAVLRELFALAAQNSKKRASYSRLIRHFLDSRFNCVQFEIAMGLGSLGAAPQIATASAAHLLRIAHDTPDINVKLVILETLQHPSLGLKALEAHTGQLLKMLVSETNEVKIKLLKIIRDQVNASHGEALANALKQCLVKALDPTGQNETNVRLQEKIIEVLLVLFRRKADQNWSISNSLLSEIIVLLIQNKTKNENLQAQIKSFLASCLELESVLQVSIKKILSDHLYSIFSPEILRCVLNLLADNSSEKESEDLLKHVVTKQFITCLMDQEKKDSASAAEEAAGADKPETLIKTVIREDGTYGTEVTMVSDPQRNKSADHNKFEVFTRSLLENSIFAVSFFRNGQKLLQKVADSKTKNQLRAQLMLALMRVYGHHLKKRDHDGSLFTELNIILDHLTKNKPIEYNESKSASKNLAGV